MFVSGVAQTNERVSEFLRNTAYKSEWLERPELQGNQGAGIAVERRTRSKRLFDFSVRLNLKRPQE